MSSSDDGVRPDVASVCVSSEGVPEVYSVCAGSMEGKVGRNSPEAVPLVGTSGTVS
jgi:hypothetical protein